MSERGRRGFTLVELLVATAIFMLIVVLLCAAYTGITQTVQRAEALKETNATGRVALEWITRDLERLRPAPAGDLYRTTMGTSTNVPMPTSGPQLFIAGGNGPIAASTRNPHAAFWQIPSEEGSARGMAIVGYFVRWVDDGAVKRPVLCRLYLPQTNSAYQQMYTSNGAWLTDDMLTANAYASTNIPANAPAGSPAYKGWLVDNVISVWFRALDANGNAITNSGASFDSRQGYTLTGGTTVQVPAPALPAAVEVAVVALDPQRMQANGSSLTLSPSLGGNPANFWDDIRASLNDTNIPRNIRDRMRVYSARIPLNYAR